MSRQVIRVALLSFWHVHAKDYALQAIEHPDVELVALWDEDKQRGQQEAEARGIAYIEQLELIWSDPTIDGVIVTTATSQHPAIMIAAARARKHIFTEKVIALTKADCDDILHAVNEANSVLTVSLPRLSMPFLQGMKQLQPLLGELTSVRARLAHSGALPTESHPNGYLPASFFDQQQAGGGALIDLGCHPMVVVRALLGMPSSLYAAFGYVTGKEVEDNAAVLLHYDNGAIGVVEAAFVNGASPFTVEVHGRHGSAIFSVTDGKLRYRSTLLSPDEMRQWHEFELPAALPSSFQQWITHIQAHSKNETNVNIARDLTTLMEAAILSHKGQSPIDIHC